MRRIFVHKYRKIIFVFFLFYFFSVSVVFCACFCLSVAYSHIFSSSSRYLKFLDLLCEIVNKKNLSRKSLVRKRKGIKPVPFSYTWPCL